MMPKLSMIIVISVVYIIALILAVCWFKRSPYKDNEQGKGKSCTPPHLPRSER